MALGATLRPMFAAALIHASVGDSVAGPGVPWFPAADDETYATFPSVMPTVINPS